MTILNFLGLFFKSNHGCMNPFIMDEIKDSCKNFRAGFGMLFNCLDSHYFFLWLIILRFVAISICLEIGRRFILLFFVRFFLVFFFAYSFSKSNLFVRRLSKLWNCYIFNKQKLNLVTESHQFIFRQYHSLMHRRPSHRYPSLQKQPSIHFALLWW